MNILKEKDLQKIKNLLLTARNTPDFSDCNNLYELFGIENKKTRYTALEIKNNEEIIKAFRKRIHGKHGKFESLNKIFNSNVGLCKKALNEGKDEYNEYLKQGIIEELENIFLICVKRDKKLDSKEKSNLIDELRDVGLSDQEINILIQNWLIKYGAKEGETEAASSTSTSSGESFYSYFNKTHYEILGIPEDADASQIKEAYDRERKEYINASGKKKAEASAKFTMVSEAYKCLKNPTTRREYDQKLNEPKGPIPTGEPELSVVRKNDVDYQFQDVRRGTILSEKITIKNTQGGLLQGTIKSDAPWLEVERNKLLEMHEQELSIRILTSKIPRKTFQVEGNVTIETNGVVANKGKEVIPFKVILEDFHRECDQFRQAYTPLSAALGGFLFSFGYSPYLAPSGVAASLLYASIYIKKDGGSFGSIVGGTIAAGIGSFIIFSILGWVGKYFPHFIGLVIGAYLIGGLAYFAADLIMKHVLNAGMNLSRFPPILVNGLSVGLVILTIFFHYGGERTYREADRVYQPKTQIKISQAFVSASVDSNNRPVGISTNFSPGNKKIYYFMKYKDALKNKTVFTRRWYKNGRLITEGKFKLKYSSGNHWFSLKYNYTPGKYEVRLFADDDELKRTCFYVNTPGTLSPKPKNNIKHSITAKQSNQSSPQTHSSPVKQSSQTKPGKRLLIPPPSRDSF